MLKVQRNSKGFTLIELLIVIAIIGILAAVAIPAYTGYTRKAKVQEVIHAMGAVKTAVMAYYTESGAAPDAADATTIMGKLGIDVPTKYLTSMGVASWCHNRDFQWRDRWRRLGCRSSNPGCELQDLDME